MTYKDEMYAHLVHGGDPQVLLDAFMKDLNEAQKKADEQLAKEKAEAERTENRNAELKKRREVLVAAFHSYITFVIEEEVSEDIVRAGVMSMEESLDALKNIKVSLNNKDYKSIFDLL